MLMKIWLVVSLFEVHAAFDMLAACGMCVQRVSLLPSES